ncbi:MAG: molybdate ABC transporter substrate-binding protein [Betaproteobacteria bacterium]
MSKRGRRTAAGAAALGLVALWAGARPAAAAEPVVVFAASSLTNVLQEAATAFEQQTGVRVLVNVGASNSQARQIVQGAPADVFCSADDPQMDVVEHAGLVAPGSRVVLTSNRLVVIVPFARARTLQGPEQLLDARFARIAVGDPAAVPVGVYTKAYLERAGLWDRLAPRLVPTVNVRAALAAVDTGNADAAFVYATDARLARRAAVAYAVPAGLAPPIRYPAAVTTGGMNREGGRRFLRFLRSAAGRAIFARFGFAAVP